MHTPVCVVDLDVLRGGAGVEVHPGRLRGAHDAREVSTRMDHARLLDGDAARIGVGAQLLVDLGASIGTPTQPSGPELVELLLEAFQLARRPGDDGETRAPVVAVEALVGHEPLGGEEGVDTVLEQPVAELGSVPLAERRSAPLQAGMEDAAIPGAGPPTQRVALQDRDTRPGARQLERRHGPRVAASHDDDVGSLGEWPVVERRDVGHGRVPIRPRLVRGCREWRCHRDRW